ncbi:hypothetical protein [Streptomyces sp. NPDC058280]|uniref:hypothetical protein n=1 Tax=Streptomyces sp. NPDC058280 TaxID=3346419 RepID=UPI0036EB60DD
MKAAQEKRAAAPTHATASAHAAPDHAASDHAAPDHTASAHAAAPRSSTPAQEAHSTPEASPAAGPGLDARSVQRLQARAGNAAVSRLVAQRYADVVKPPPAQAPGFRKVQQDVAAKKQNIKRHKPAAAESKSAQDAAVAPPDDKQAQGKAANAEKMNAAKPGEFDKSAFIGAVNEAISAQAPKNLDEADNFADSGKADHIKDSVDGKVKDGKKSSAEDIETATTAAPDLSQAKEKQVTPMGPDQPTGNPGAPSAADAVPAKQPDKVLDFSEGNQQVDQQLADSEVTEEQLAKGNEPQFDKALSEKKKGEQNTAAAPAKGRAAEGKQLAAAQAGAAVSGAQAMNAMTADRNAAGKAVDSGKGETKSADEKKREQVTAKLQKVFDTTQKDVEKILGDLDGKVDKQFTDGEKKARGDFTADHKRRMKDYKDKRYSGFTGKGRWIRDKFKGLPQAGLDIFKKSRELYVSTMQTVIASIADTIGTELGRAKTRIAEGRSELKAEVDRLPADLKQFGQEAAADFAGKFDDLESEVNDKSTQLVQDLAQKYTEALNSVDEEIKKLEEENKGPIAAVMNAVVGVIQTINELKNLLLGVLAKAAGVAMKIIKDPIGFLRNFASAVGAGLNLFIGNIPEHLKKGLVSWLLGTAVSTGLEIPAKFDLKGIIQLIASLLGLTWDNIRARVTRKGVPDEAMTKVEQSVPVAGALAREGPAGAAQEITAETGDLKSTILDDLKSYLIPTVLMAGITWILSLLNPASAFIRAVKGIIDIVTFIVTQGAQIIEFVNACLDAVIAIANGAQAGVPKLIETALATSIPLLIGLLASLLGIGGLANRVKQAFQKASRPVTRAIDKIVNKITNAGKKIWSRLSREKGGDGRNRKQKENDLDAGLDAADSLVKQGLTRKEILPKLPEIRRRYRMRELTLVHDGKQGTKELVHVKGAVNPSGQRVTQPIPGLYESIDPSEKGRESFIFKGDGQPAPPRNDKVEITTEVRLMDGKSVKATGHVKNSFDVKTNDITMKEHFLDAIPSNKRWIESPGVPLRPGKGTPLVTYVNLRQMRRFENYSGNLAVKGVKAELRRQNMPGLEPEAERELRESRSLYGAIKSITLDNVENIPAILQLHDQLNVRPGVDLNQVILSTHSVTYVDTIIIQAGGRIKSAEVIGGESRTIGELMRHYEETASKRRKEEVRAYHEQLLMQYGVARSEKVLMNFDVKLNIEPFGSP